MRDDETVVSSSKLLLYLTASRDSNFRSKVAEIISRTLGFNPKPCRATTRLTPRAQTNSSKKAAVQVESDTLSFNRWYVKRSSKARVYTVDTLRRKRKNYNQVVAKRMNEERPMLPPCSMIPNNSPAFPRPRLAIGGSATHRILRLRKSHYCFRAWRISGEGELRKTRWMKYFIRLYDIIRPHWVIAQAAMCSTSHSQSPNNSQFFLFLSVRLSVFYFSLFIFAL